MTNPSEQTESLEQAGWITVGRPGYVGKNRRGRERRLNRLFGAGNWRIQHLWERQVLDRDAALALYEEAYYRHLADHSEVLDWLCRTASDVYDLAPSNVASGLDYHCQECTATHLQDIAVRRCLQRLGRPFAGDHLVEIRGRDSEGYRLNPGQVPFHQPEGILRPSLSRDAWWDEASIEDFWQSNKVLQVRDSVPEEALRAHLLQPLEPAKGASADVAMFGGSFNPIHLGHLRVAQDLLDLYRFSRVIFVPNGNHYGKKDLIDEGQRAQMVRLAIADEPRFELCDFELGRDQVVHTDETLQHLQKKLAGELKDFRLFNVRGSDTVARMLRWRSLPRLLEAIQIVPLRPGSDPWQAFGRDETFRLYGDRFRLLPRACADGLSATLVRKRIAAGGSPRYLVPDKVAAYLREHRLYQD